ncbi:dynamin family protein [Streptomyces luteogriseus]
MGSHDQRTKDIAALFPEAVGAALSAGSDTSVARLHEAEHRLYQQQASVVVLGEFSRGKSSLLNALLEEPDLLPVDASTSTRAVTALRWGADEVITVSLAGRGGKPAEKRRVSRAELRSYLCEAAVSDGEGAADAERVSAVSISVPNLKLRNGLRIVDTPGVGGVHRAHSTAALGVLPMADAVLYVTDALQPLLASELAFIDVIARAVDAAGHPERLLFVITKCDQSPDTEAAVEDVRARLRAVPGLEPERVTVVPVSSHLRLHHLADGDTEDFLLSNFGELEEKLWSSVSRSRELLLQQAALDELESVTASLLAPAEAALAVLETADRSEQERLAAAAEAREKEAAALADGAARWPTELAEAMAEVTAELRHRADSGLGSAWREIRHAYRADEELAGDQQLLLDAVAGRLALLVGELGEVARKRAADVHGAFARGTGLRLSAAAPRDVAAPPLPVGSATVRQGPAQRSSSAIDDLGQALEAAVEGARRGAEAGSRLGELTWEVAVHAALSPRAGTVVRVLSSGERPSESPAAAVGRVLGGIVGATLSFARQLGWLRDVARGDRIAAIDHALEPWEGQQREFLHTALAEVVDAYTRQVTEDMRRLIEERRSECALASERIAAARAAVGQDRAAQRTAAQERCDTLRSLLERIQQRAQGMPVRAAS